MKTWARQPRRVRERERQREIDREKEWKQGKQQSLTLASHESASVGKNKTKAAFASARNEWKVNAKSALAFPHSNTKTNAKAKTMCRPGMELSRHFERFACARSFLWLSLFGLFCGFLSLRPKAALAAQQQLTTIAIVKANARRDGATFNKSSSNSSRGSAAAAVAVAATVLTASKSSNLYNERLGRRLL